MAMTNIEIRRHLTPRLFFDGTLAGCTVGLGAMLAVQTLAKPALSGLAWGEALGFMVAILLCVIGVLFGDGLRRGDLGRRVASLVAMALSVIFAFACLPLAAALLGIAVEPHAVLLAAWNASIAGALAVVTVAALRRWPG